MASFNLKKTKEMVVPSKRTMNFCHHRNPVDLKRLIPVLVIICVVILLFVKFCIIDMIQVERAAYDRLAEKKAQLAGLEVGLKDYDKVADMYGRFSYGWMNETEVNTVNRLQVLALIESKVGPSAVVENMAVNDNSLTLIFMALLWSRPAWWSRIWRPVIWYPALLSTMQWLMMQKKPISL